MRLRSILVGLLILGASVAHAASVAPVNPNNLFIPGTAADFNSLINSINGILYPMTGAGIVNGTAPNSGVPAINVIALDPAVTGNPPIIDIAPGGDANASIGIQPNGNGNVVLFPSIQPGLWASTSTGMLQFGNASGVIKANGFAPCPGMATNRPPMLGIPATVVTGFFMVEDWLGFQYAVPACGNQFGASLRGSF